MFDLPPVDTNKLWTPPKPAISRPWKDTIAKADAPQFESSFPFPSFVPGAAVATATVSLEYSQLTGTPSGQVHTVNSVPFGAADANRIIVAAFGWNGTGGVFSSATIAGGTATIALNMGGYGSGRKQAIVYLAVSSGTSGTIVLNFSNLGGVVQPAMAVWRVVYVNSATPIATASQEVVSGVVTIDVNTLANSIVCAFARAGSGRTWTGIISNYSLMVSGTHVGYNSLIAAGTPSAAGLSAAGSIAGAASCITWS